uniref:Serine protease hepsin n=1 Tax=Cacopsylla melanoneura TaxID=428564 RepID=A0A8D8YK17_9HEMI
MEIDEQEFYFTGNEIYSHPNYNFNTDENDIAIIKLKSTIQFNKYADAITLPGQGLQYEQGLWCTISGWGKTEKEDHPNILQIATVVTHPDNLCKSEDFYGTKIKKMMFCAGSQLGGSDSCQGDSGGPLVCEVTDQKDYVFSVQYGIVSYGIGCGVADKPGVYTKLSEFHDWINETLNSPDRPEDKNLRLRMSNNEDILGDQEKKNICSLPHPTELCVKGKGPADEFCKKIARAAGNSNKPLCLRNRTCTFHVNQPSSGDVYVSLSKTNSDGIIHSCSNNDLHVVEPNFTSDLTDARKDTSVDGPNWRPLGINPCGLIDDSVKKVEFKSSSKKVVGGEITERGQLPWQVGLYRKPIDADDDFKLFCGGSIITKQHILTAAHCFT